MQGTLKPDKNNGYFSWRPVYIFYYILLSSSQSEIFQTNFVEGIKTYFMFIFFGNLTIYEIM